jgi:hypothetical protein
MARRRTIGENPLDALLTPRRAAPRPADTRGKGKGRPAGKSRPEPSSSASARATFHLPVGLIDDAKNAVIALSGPPVRLTLAALVREALTRELERLRKVHYGGKPWPVRSGPLVGGRPMKS